MESLIILSVLIIVLAVMIELGTRPVVSRLKNANVVFEEFPSIEESDLQKFSSFDSELGWERQPNESRKKDTGHQRPDDPTAESVVYSTDAYASRVCEIDRSAGEYSIATYGDSYCFCRDVKDNETFQHYLSQGLGVHVSNYGVGNYGLDQGLLRMKRRFDEDPADYTIIALCDKVAINRILSSWKHYYEFGNTFAIKPRFKLVGGDLETIPTPINSREDLLRLEAHADYLRENDYHYENWFKPHLLKRPYSTYWLRSKNNIPYATFSVLEFISRKFYSPKPLHEKSKVLKKYWERKKRTEQGNKQQYRNHLENEFVDLFCNILKEFERFSKSRNSVPIFLPIRHPDYYGDEQVDPLNKQVLDEIQSNCTGITIIDPREDIFEHCDDPEDLYAKPEKISGHPSPKHNRLNAEYIAKEIQKHRSKSPDKITFS